MKKILYIILFLLFFTTISYAETGIVFNSESKTIKELRSDLEKIEKKEIKVETKIEDFIKNSKLREYIKKDLTKDEFVIFKNLIEDFNYEKDNLEKDIKENKGNLEIIKKIKDDLLNKKLKLYKNMTEYVIPSKYSLYSEYVKSEAKIFLEKTEIEAKKVETEVIMIKKVEILEEKIRKHKKALAEDLRKLIEEKLEKKIKSLGENKDFIELKNKSKVKLITKTIKKAENRINKLKVELEEKEHGEIFEESYNKKIEIYYISIKKLKDFRKQFEYIKK